MASALVPILRGAGYRKEQRTFRRASPECVQVVNVQLSQWGSRTSQQFTVNLGVFFPEVHEALAGYLQVRIGQAGPTEYQCQIRQRLGMLMPGNRDVWWGIEAGREPSGISRKVGEAMTAYGLPWLEGMAVLETARREVERWAPLQALGFDIAAGDTDRAQRRFRELLTGNAAPKKLRSWGRAHGLLE